MKNQTNWKTIEYIKEGFICAEIGVWQGDLSKKILKQRPKELHLIDPWETQDVIDRCFSKPQSHLDNIYNKVCEEFSSFHQVTIHRKYSTSVSFPEKYFDWVYIDADHSYEAVKRDLEFYYPLIKTGGYLCGDDYGLWEDKPNTGFGSDGGGGPKPAVDEFVAKHNLKLKIIESPNFEKDGVTYPQFVIFI